MLIMFTDGCNAIGARPKYNLEFFIFFAFIQRADLERQCFAQN